MPYNIGTVTTSRMSYGPAVVYLGVSGTTPLADVGAVDEDGVELEFASTFIDVMQGNPGNVVQRYITQQDAFCRFDSIEWGVNQIAWTLGTGTTSISGSQEVLAFGGDPCPADLALYVQHRKACVAHTVNVRFWKATPETGSFTVQFGNAAVHSHNHAFKAIRATTNWASGSLSSGSQLVQMTIDLT